MEREQKVLSRSLDESGRSKIAQRIEGDTVQKRLEPV